MFSGTVGGAPCNALAQAAKLGSRTAFIGMVGDDAFGRACAHQLDELKIDRTYLAVTQQADTTLAFVTLDKNGDRDFTFYRRPGADTLLTVKNIPFDRIAQSRVYLFGGVSLSQDPTRAAVFYSLFKLSGTSVLRAFDPNLRPVLWEDLDEAKALGRKAMGLCDILKLSSEEAVFFSGRQNPLDGARALQEEFRIPLVFNEHGFQRMFCFAARRSAATSMQYQPSRWTPLPQETPSSAHSCTGYCSIRLPLWTSFLPDRSSKPLNLPLPPRRLPSPAADRFLLCPYWRKSRRF